MKRFLFAAGMLVFLLASCNKTTEEVAVTMQVGTEILTVDTKSETPAMPVGYALRYVTEVWEDNATICSHREEQLSESYNPVNFSIRLERYKSYDILFWADYVPADATIDHTGGADTYYITNQGSGLQQISLSDLTPPNQSARDAFALAYSISSLDESQSPVILLERPLARMNVKTGDLAALGADRSVKSVEVSYAEEVPTTYNVLTQSVTGSTYRTFHSNIVTPALPEANLWYDYFFVTEAPPLQDNYTIEVVFYSTLADETTQVEEARITINNIPVKRNYQTNLSGDLLGYMLNFSTSLGIDFVGNEEVDELEDEDEGEGEGGTQTDYAIGDPYPDAVSPTGVVFRAKSAGEPGLVVSLEESKGAWSLEQVVTGGADGMDGAANTAAVRATPSYSGTAYPIFGWLDTTYGSTSNWYIPAASQLKILFDNLALVNATLGTIGSGTTISTGTSSGMYWSSTEVSNTKARHFKFYDGTGDVGTGAATKTTASKKVRAVCEF